jgi:hypothetical protein
VLGNGIPLVGAPFDHPIGNIVVQMVYKAKMVENFNTKMVNDEKMLEGAIASSFLPKIIILFSIGV